LLDLRSPGGVRLDLTDRWRSPDTGTYYLRQSGSCVWFGGFSPDIGALGGEATANWTNAFFGHLATDFTLRGSWADLPWGDDDGVGDLAWRVIFAQVDGEESVTLEVTEVIGNFSANYLVKPESPVDLPVRLQEDEGCLRVVDDTGATYELIVTAPGWVVATPLRLFGPDGEEVLPADEFAVRGEVARGSGACGPGLILFADEVEVTTAP
jgi:hypothetical protein